MSSIAHTIEVSPLVRPVIPNPHLWLEATRLPYAGYDHILSKQIGELRVRTRHFKGTLGSFQAD